MFTYCDWSIWLCSLVGYLGKSMLLCVYFFDRSTDDETMCLAKFSENFSICVHSTDTMRCVSITVCQLLLQLPTFALGSAKKKIIQMWDIYTTENGLILFSGIHDRIRRHRFFRCEGRTTFFCSHVCYYIKYTYYWKKIKVINCSNNSFSIFMNLKFIFFFFFTGKQNNFLPDIISITKGKLLKANKIYNLYV